MSDPREGRIHPKVLVTRVMNDKVIAPKADEAGDQVASMVSRQQKTLNSSARGFSGKWNDLLGLRSQYASTWAVYWNLPTLNPEQYLRKNERLPIQHDVFVYFLYCELRLALACRELDQFLDSNFPYSVIRAMNLETLYPSFYRYFFSLSDQEHASQLYSEKERPHRASNLDVLLKIAWSLKKEGRKELTAIEFQSLCSIFSQQLINERIENTRDIALELHHHVLVTSSSIGESTKDALRNSDTLKFKEVMNLIQLFLLNFYLFFVDPDSNEISHAFAVEFWTQLSKNLFDPNHPEATLTAFITGLYMRDAHSGEIYFPGWFKRLNNVSTPRVAQLRPALLSQIDRIGLPKMYTAQEVMQIFAPLDFIMEADPILALNEELQVSKEQFFVELTGEDFMKEDLLLGNVDKVIVGIDAVEQDVLSVLIGIVFQDSAERKYLTFTIDLRENNFDVHLNLIDAFTLPIEVVSRLLHFLLLANYKNKNQQNSSEIEPVFVEVGRSAAANYGILPDVVVRTPGAPGVRVPKHKERDRNKEEEKGKQVPTKETRRKYSLVFPEQQDDVIVRGVDERTMGRILNKIKDYKDTGAGNVATFSVQNRPDEGVFFQLRVGDYRVLAHLDGTSAWIFAICHRDYEKLILNGHRF